MHILEMAENQLQGQGDGRNDAVLNYTLIMDSAPGPHTDKDELLLSVKPNPVLVEVKEESRTYYTTGSEDTITIIVRTHACQELSFKWPWCIVNNIRERIWIQLTSRKLKYMWGNMHAD